MNIDRDRETVEVFGEIRKETDKAMLLFDGVREVWIPKSMIEYSDTNKYGQTLVEIPEWLAYDKGLI